MKQLKETTSKRQFIAITKLQEETTKRNYKTDPETGESKKITYETTKRNYKP